MKIASLVVAALLSAVSQVGAQNPAPMRDTTAYTTSGTGLRAQPQLAATVLTNLPAGWPVRVASCVAGWCAAETGSLSGYLLADSLTLAVPRGASVPAPTTAKAVVPGTSIGVDLTTRLTFGFAAGPKLRIAPEVSYVSDGSKSYATSTQIGDYTIDNSDTDLWLGLGFYYVTPLPVRPLGAPCLLYLGPRLGLAFSSAETKVDNAVVPTDAKASRTDFWAGFAIGSELMLSAHFSVGAEGQLTKVFLGGMDVTGVTTSSLGVGQSWRDFQTLGTLVMRFYP
jgi:hypothetical protein